MPTRIRADWTSRRRVTMYVEAIVVAATVALAVTQRGDIAHTATTHGAFWLMTGLAMLAGTQTFVAAMPPGRR